MEWGRERVEAAAKVSGLKLLSERGERDLNEVVPGRASVSRIGKGATHLVRLSLSTQGKERSLNRRRKRVTGN